MQLFAFRLFGYAVGLTFVRVDSLDEWWDEVVRSEGLAPPSKRC